MISYLLIIIIPTILYIIDEFFDTKNGIFKKIAIFILIVISSLRYNFGADYHTYEEAYYRFQNNIFTDKFEIGYRVLNILVSKTGAPFFVLLLIISSFNFILIYKSIEDNVKKYRWLSLFCYLAYFDLFFYSLSALRQSIVISIVLYTIKYLIKKDFKKYICWIIFGSLFHVSVLFMIPIYLLFQILRNKKLSFTIIFYLSITIGYDLFINYIYLLKPYLGNKLQYYIFIFDNSQISYSIIYVLIAEILMIFWICFSSILKNKYVNNIAITNMEEIGIYSFYITFLLCLKVFQYIQYFSILPRIQLFFYAPFILLVPNILLIFKSGSRTLLKYAIFLLLIINFVARYYEVNNVASSFYKNFNLILWKGLY